MGKLKRPRQKLHISKKEINEDKNNIALDNTCEGTKLLPLNQPDKDLFKDLEINLGHIKANISDDGKSMKSLISFKNENFNNTLSKKQKLKLRRELLLKKIDTVNQMKRELKLRQKRKNTALIGDTNPLHDALPSLDSLTKHRTNVKYNAASQKTKKKAIEKASARKKKLTRDVNVFKHMLKNKSFLKNPFEAISSHIETIVEQEQILNK